MSLLKAPICSVMGHVDAGKTSLIDIIKKSNIAASEAGGITQTVSGNYITIDSIIDKTKVINGKYAVEPTIPGLVIIDTPGHEAFNIMRENGSSLCDIAIVVININEGIMPQTLESINMLRKKKVPFIIAANKLDMIPYYNVTEETSLRKALKNQKKDVMAYITATIEDLKYDFGKHGMKSEFYFQNKKPSSIYSIVPISSKTGEGISDLLPLYIYISQNWMNHKIEYKDTIEGMVVSCYKDKHKGWLIDVILKNGTIKNSDSIIVMKDNTMVISNIRKIFQGKKELDNVMASNYITLMGSNLDNVMVGSSFHQYTNKASLDTYIEEMKSLWNKLSTDTNGVIIVSPTLASVDALYKVLKKDNINIRHYIVGELTDKNFTMIKTMLENEKDIENKVVLNFSELKDNIVSNITSKLKTFGVHFMSSDIIYNLIEKYKEYRNKIIKERQEEQIVKGDAVYPCELEIFKEYIFMKGGNKELVFGVKVKNGKLRIGSPLIVLNPECQSEKELLLGNVVSLQKNNENIMLAERGDEVCIKLNNPNGLAYDRHFTYKHMIISRLTRQSIDVLKKDYRDIMTKEDWLIVINHMKILGIKKNS